MTEHTQQHTKVNGQHPQRRTAHHSEAAPAGTHRVQSAVQATTSCRAYITQTSHKKWMRTHDGTHTTTHQSQRPTPTTTDSAPFRGGASRHTPCAVSSASDDQLPSLHHTNESQNGLRPHDGTH